METHGALCRLLGQDFLGGAAQYFVTFTADGAAQCFMILFFRDIEKQIGCASSGVSRVVAKLHLNCIFKLRHIGMKLQFVQYEIIIKFARRVYCDTVELQIILLSNNVIKS